MTPVASVTVASYNALLLLLVTTLYSAHSADGASVLDRLVSELMF